MIKKLIAVFVLSIVSGCSTMYRAELSSDSAKQPVLEIVNLDDFFIYNGFQQSNWSYDLFGATKRTDVKQKILTYWSKSTGREFYQAWVMEEGSDIAIYISSGDYVMDETSNLKSALAELYPSVRITITKKLFADPFR